MQRRSHLVLGRPTSGLAPPMPLAARNRPVHGPPSAGAATTALVLSASCASKRPRKPYARRANIPLREGIIIIKIAAFKDSLKHRRLTHEHGRDRIF
jgi:hypothetical protein